MKVLSPFIHGIIDYAVGALLLLAPMLFGFSGVPEILCYVLGVGHIGYSLLTRYPLGLFKLIPFRIHGIIESVAGVFLLVSPWLFDFADDVAARNFFIGSAIAVGVVVLLTRYRTTPEEEHGRGRLARIGTTTSPATTMGSPAVGAR